MILKVISKKKETKNITSLLFEKPVGFSFYSGQYLDIELKTDDRFKVRAFSISASPTEDFLMISPKKGVSKFKKDLYKLKVGDKISSSHPAGTFILDENEKAVFIAGGIGITPFRSIIKYIFDKKIKTPIALIYSNSDKNFPFKKELDTWKKAYPKLAIHYIVTRKDGRLTEKKLSSILRTANYRLPIYYLAGPPKMVDDLEKMLISMGVEETNIRTDRFDGY